VNGIQDCGVIVLAGGKGTRLGSSKPHVILGSITLLQHVIDAAVNLSDEVVLVVGSDDDSLSSLENQHPSITIIRDSRNGVGPMMGIYTGMKRLTTGYSLVLPCDAPFISVPMMRELIMLARDSDAAIPIWPNQNLEPLHSVYRTSPSIQAIESALQSGEKSVLDLIKRLERINYVPVEALREFDSELLTFFNVNYPEDLKTAHEIQSRNRSISSLGDGPISVIESKK
jgi:molybdopterin-guanine dinucleotide biosynthesis protein A